MVEQLQIQNCLLTNNSNTYSFKEKMELLMYPTHIMMMAQIVIVQMDSH